MKLRLRKATKSLKDRLMYRKYIDKLYENWLYVSDNDNSISSSKCRSTHLHYFDGMDTELESFFNDYVKYLVESYDDTANSIYFIEIDDTAVGMISFLTAVKGTYRITEWTLEKGFFNLRSEILDEIKEILKEKRAKNKSICICTPLEEAGRFLVEAGFVTDGDGFYYLHF